MIFKPLDKQMKHNWCHFQTLPCLALLLCCTSRWLAVSRGTLETKLNFSCSLIESFTDAEGFTFAQIPLAICHNSHFWQQGAPKKRELDGNFLTTLIWRGSYLVDVLWCQPIMLIQVVSTSEFHEYWWKDVDFIFFVPSI